MSSLVTVEAPGTVAVASAAWRHRGNIRATVVVKSEFSFADGVLTQVPAQPIQPETEMAFVLVQAEVLFGGLSPQGGGPLRIGIWRGSQALINHEIQAGLSSSAIGGRISPFAPTRSQHLHGFSPAALHQPFVELPDTFDTTFFQSAAPALRLGGLVGGDAVVVENLYPGHRRLLLRLPTVQVSGTGRMGDRAAPIRFNMDTVFIDAENHRCSILWRGRLAASNPEALSRAKASVELGVTEPGGVEGDVPPPWAQAAQASPFGEGTVDLGKTAVAEAAAMTATPFAKSASSAPRSDPRAAIPGAPWAGGASDAPAVPLPEGIKETVGIEDLQNLAPTPGGVKLPPGIRKPKAVSAPPAVPAPVAAPAPAAVPAPPPVSQPDPSAQEQAQAQAEAARAEEERKKREIAEAEDRRRQDAERFAAEQQAAAKAEADRTAQKIEERKKMSKKIKTSVYGKFGKKR